MKAILTRQTSRPEADNPNHHIWNNNGTWWCHFTVHHADYTAERVRVSLHTRDQAEARQRRDFIMAGTSSIVATWPQGAVNAARRKSGDDGGGAPDCRPIAVPADDVSDVPPRRHAGAHF
jgi:hypothetical protein